MENSLIFMLLLQVVLILLNAVFACAEIAVISMNDNKLAKMAASGDKRALRLSRLTSQPARFLATIQVAITLSGFLGSAFAADNFSDTLVEWMINLGVSVPVSTLDTLSVIIITIVLSYFTLIFGELVPKRIAMRKAEVLALGMSSLITVISKIFAPIVSFLTISTNLVLRLIGIDPDAEDENVSEEDICMMVDVGTQNGVIDQEEKEFIHNIFEFDDLTAGEIATHRTQVSILWLEDSLDEWKASIHDDRHSRYPVCNESVDDVVGVLSSKDYFRLEERTMEQIMEKAVKPAYFVPESLKADILFKNMKDKHSHFAVVLDEYGGMSGVITMNDLIEKLVGELGDEESLEVSTPDIEKIDSETWLIKGSTSVLEVSKALNVTLPCTNYDTFNGLIFGELGVFPEDGGNIDMEIYGLKIQATEIHDHKIDRALVKVINSQLEQ